MRFSSSKCDYIMIAAWIYRYIWKTFIWIP